MVNMLPTGLIGLVFAITSTKAATQFNGGQAVLLDTDLMGDVDDVGALAVANVLHNCELADLRGIAINTNSKYGALAASAISTYFGNSHIPIAAIRPLTNDTYFDSYSYNHGEFASKVAYHWPRTLKDASHTPEPRELYRSVLHTAANNSLRLISIGFLTNLAELLRSQPDTVSDLTGLELISTKVNELIVMGGSYPSGWEFNFGGSDPESATYVLEHWPDNVAITFSGVELGGNIYSGQDLARDAPPDSPILAAYQWYVGRCYTTRESWDPLTTLYGIIGLDGFKKLGLEPLLAFANQYGYNSITSKDGGNAWINDTRVTNQHWLRLANGVTNSSVASLLDDFLTHTPNEKRCLKPDSREAFVNQYHGYLNRLGWP